MRQDERLRTGPIFDVREVSFAYPGSPRPAVANVTFDVPPGGFFAVLGPNGSGKSTLLRLLLGALSPASGVVLFQGRPVGDWSRRDLARRIGAVPQSEELGFPWTVRELVEMGRYPHLGTWRSPGAGDRAAVAAALARCEVTELAGRVVGTLSGGERQRARLARALAQEPAVLVLDEPTASLDIRHEMRIFELLAELSARDGVTVVVVTHNLNLAARYADTLLLMDDGRPAALGTPDQVMRQDVLERVYEWPVAVRGHAGPGPDEGAPQVVPLAGQRPEPAGPAVGDRERATGPAAALPSSQQGWP